MPPKKRTSDAVASTLEYEYEDNLSIRVRAKTDRDHPELYHYFGPLLRDDKAIDELHKYCSTCLESHTIKR